MAHQTKWVLFICSGNYYRSRFAEAVFNHRALQSRTTWRAFSRGLAIHLVDGDLSPHTEEGLRHRGIDRALAGPTRTMLGEPDLRKASRVIALKEQEHRPLMQQMFPQWADRITYWRVHDLDCIGPEEALPQIEELVASLADELS
jgi:protein-tyrosine phosphatase